MRTLSFLLFFSVLCFHNANAQADTINTKTGKLNAAALKEGQASYVVFWEDSLGHKITSADIWDRSVKITSGAAGKQYEFEWKWIRKDTVIATVTATGALPSFTPMTHEADYGRRGQFAYVFKNDSVFVPTTAQKTSRDSSFAVALDPPAFEFPMDLELFPLLPFKKAGQKFLMAFYEPGGSSSKYYPLAVTSRESLALPGGATVLCWLLRIDYAPGSYATFWISDKTREVLKMREYFRGRFRVKQRLYP